MAQSRKCMPVPEFSFQSLCKNDRNGDDEMSQQLRGVTSLAEDLSSGPSTNVWEAQNHL